MRTIRIGLLVSVLALPWMGAVSPVESIAQPGVVLAQEQGGAPDVDVNINGGGDTKYTIWLSNPVLLAAGGVAILVIALLIAMAARGGGTTVIKD